MAELDKRFIPAEQVEQIRNLILDGYSQDKIAKDFGISISTIRTVIRNNKLQHVAAQVRQNRLDSAILELYAQGYSTKAIRAELSLEPSAVRGALLREGIKKGKRTTEEEVLYLYHVRSLPLTVIAKKLRISYKRVKKIVDNCAHPLCYSFRSGEKIGGSREEVRALYAQGKTIEEISEELNISTYQIRRDVR